MFALIDCDHFFASCERVFRPDLWKRPVAVLSNNDGCVIARSPEVKALGIKMGEPFFQCKDVLNYHNVALFSSNFSLYADLSNRVIHTIRELIESSSRPRVEVYSIDEAFVDLQGLSPSSYQDLAYSLKCEIFRRTGIPVSIGIAPSKTLAKVSTHFAKKTKEHIYLIQTEDQRLEALRSLPVEAIWGVGQKWAERLKRVGLDSALDLAQASPQRLRTVANHINLKRLARELRGERCIPLESSPPPRASIQYSRTFSSPISHPQELQEAVAAFAAELGRRLRSHQRRTGTLLLWLSTSLPHRGRRTNRSSRPLTYTLKLSKSTPAYTDDTSSLIRLAHILCSTLVLQAEKEAPSHLKRPLRWRKAGLLALDLRDHTQLELNLVQPNSKLRRLSQLEDELNRRFGRGTASIGGLPNLRSPSSSLSSPSWQSRHSALSPRYTTCWTDLPIVKA